MAQRIYVLMVSVSMTRRRANFYLRWSCRINSLQVWVRVVGQVVEDSVSKKDEIWSGNEKVWHYLPSSKITAGYVQAFCIAMKVIEARGDNGFLGASGSTHRDPKVP